MNAWAIFFLAIAGLEFLFMLWLAIDQRTKLWANWVFHLLYSSARRQKAWFVMVDVNGLKAVNDRYGHEIGDQVLFAVAQILKRATGIWFRLGGDEFVGLVSANVPEKKMEILVENICQQVLKSEVISSPMFESGLEKIRPEIAVGFAKGMREADKKMYQDKEEKKNIRKLEQR